MRHLSKIKAVIAVICATAGFGAAALAAMPLVSNSWSADLLSNFRIVYLFVLATSIVVCALTKYYKTTIALLLVLLPVAFDPLRMFLPSGAAPSVSSLKVLNYNTEFQHNDDFRSFCELVSKEQPDVIALVEVNKKWMDALSPAAELREYKHQVISLTGPGMALFSKVPIQTHDIRFFGKSHHPRISATLTINEGCVDVLIAHPTTPKTEAGFAERNQELELMAKEVKALGPAKILIGDLNCGSWSSYFSNLLSDGLLADSQQSFGIQPSWPARIGRVWNFVPVPPLIPIDHVLVGPSISVRNRHLGPSIGSDHKPVLVEMDFARLNPCAGDS